MFPFQFDSVSGKQFDTRLILLFFTVCLASYPITILSQFDFERQCIVLVEFVMIFGAHFVNCAMSEVLEWGNCRIRQSVYQSHWYKMCPEAQRMILMFLRCTPKETPRGDV
uniref:Uncharacterized protein n=1 Tax=Cacopsylla melanoneura TaxID=428564 RepID=A0A8D8RSK0_9HEMI